ncbi:sialidase family protein [Variovorax paradoxus]|uniref:sialidase family protein n=1 Tax=Variovorax paradoxus TaxID=34073 RepID=UPI00277F69D8|nr:sialidase family protein [Variovorax paradoxus]MDP9933506.1 hypothetical protein [Variovorax paradoxus]
MFYDTPTVFSVTTTSTKTIAEPVNVGIIDRQGVIMANARISMVTQLKYFASMTTNRALAAGTHTGSLEVRVCYDDPLTCARPVEGSPWQLPYTIRVIDPASLSYQRWEVAQTTPGYLDNFALSYRAGKPIVVAAGFYTRVMETWASDDVGTTWTKLTSPTSPTPLVRGFALASDDTAIYLSGGQNLTASGPTAPTAQYQSHIWKFDGTDWQARTGAAGFAQRADHVMAKVGSSLYVAGGRNGAGSFRDLWRSVDDGATWSKVIDTLPAALGNPTCALNWQGSLLLAGDAVATSPDGVSWTVHGGYPAKFPKKSVQCAVLGNRLFLVAPDGNSYSVSTTDLANWKYERSPVLSAASNAPGMAAIDGRLVVTTGQGTSERSVFRTVP